MCSESLTMKLSNRFDGSNAPFQGEATSLLKSIPANAQIQRATAGVTPVDPTRGFDPFVETITFDRARGDWGATKSLAPGGWVEVDFHGRRTLTGVRGTNLINTTLQVDLGGAYVEINGNGAVKGPPPDVPFSVKSNSHALPSLAVTKFKLTKPAPPIPPPPQPPPDPDITEVAIRSIPTNVSLRLGLLPAFWTHLGELTGPETTPNFAAVLQAFLTDAQVENGFYVVPLILHSDTIGRLTVDLEIEYLVQETALPPGLNEVALPFDFSGPPKTQPDVLQIAVPANSRVAARGTKARVTGAFEETRIVYNPLEFAAAPAGAVEILPTLSHAQSISLDSDLAATAVDLLLGVTETSRLQLDLRNDFDGKPDNTSLLPEPVPLELPGPVSGALGPEAAPRFKWVSVTLPAEVRFQSKKKVKRYWLVLQSIEGKIEWSVAAAPDANALSMQRTQDGGLSWRETSIAGPVAGFFRLRRKPERFQMPIELQVGMGTEAVRVKLDRFAPLGRVDFTLDFDEVAEALNQHLAASSGSSCPEIEHLANGDFEKWAATGDKIGKPRRVRNNQAAETAAVAFGPDGQLAYVGNGGVRLIEVACDKFLPDKVDFNSGVEAIAIHPDGTRAYIISGGNLSILDTAKLRTMGESVNKDGAIRQVALSPDGLTLYALEDLFVWAVSTKDLEQSVLTGKTTLANAVFGEIQFEQFQTPVALAVAPDGHHLYVAFTSGPTTNGDVRVFDAAKPELPPNIIPVGRDPRALALTPDGKLAVVVNRGESNLHIIDTAKKAIVGGAVTVGSNPVCVAVSPDGNKAYVSSSGDDSISVIDLARREVVETIRELGGSPFVLAVTPQGDRIYVVITDDGSVRSIPIGLHLPAEWELTSGNVTHICFPNPFHLAAVLGTFSQEQNLRPTALSQVAPVADSCLYEFNFWGVASETGAVAEIFWLGQDCGFLRADNVPIEALKTEPGAQASGSEFVDRVISVEGKPPLVLHRVRLMSPLGAEQAEVRFSVPDGMAAVVTQVSLAGTTESVANADFSLVQEGRLAGWTISPAPAPGVALLAADGGIRVRNAGAETARLVQTIPVQGSQPFELEFQGQTPAQRSTHSSPRLELRWLKADGAQVGELTTLDISPTGFDSSAAQGTSPAEATQAEIHLVIPSNTTQEVRRISLRFLTPTVVPVTFISQAPGELTVSDLRVAFDRAEPKPPQIPKKGLCASTPPGRQPGTADMGHGFCHSCGTEEEMTDTTPAVTMAGRPAQVGHCSVCATEVVRVGGPSVIDAPRLARSRMSPGQPVIHFPTTSQVDKVKKAETEAVASPPAPPVLTDIPFIGEARAKQLSAVGIDSVAALASVTPEEVMKVKGISRELATRFIEKANELLASDK
jgi:YVTN family beta-propeller protein